MRNKITNVTHRLEPEIAFYSCILCYSTITIKNIAPYNILILKVFETFKSWYHQHIVARLMHFDLLVCSVVLRRSGHGAWGFNLAYRYFKSVNQILRWWANWPRSNLCQWISMAIRRGNEARLLTRLPMQIGDFSSVFCM